MTRKREPAARGRRAKGGLTVDEQLDRMARNTDVHEYFTAELKSAQARGLKRREAHVAATEATARHFGISKATNAKSRQRAVQRIRTEWSKQERKLKSDWAHLDSAKSDLARDFRQVTSWFSRAELDSHQDLTLSELACLAFPRAAAHVDDLQRQVNDLQESNSQLEKELRKCRTNAAVKAAGLDVYSKSRKS
jgi:hypothetical protein